MLIFGSYLPGLYFAFYCAPLYQSFYMTCVALMSL